MVGGRGDSGAGGIALGSTASSAAHTAPLPVLLARPAPSDRVFPAAILIATNGSSDSERGIELAGRIATAHGSAVTLLHVSDGQSQPRLGAEPGVAGAAISLALISLTFHPWLLGAWPPMWPSR